MLPKILSLALSAGTALASPFRPSSPATPASSIGPGDPFGVIMLRSGSDIHFQPWQAALSSIFAFLPSQNATCNDGTEPTNPSYATFVLSRDGGLYLYTTHGPTQQLYADRSGMGQGKFGYTTGDKHGPRYGERTKFSLDKNDDLTFNGAGFLACPNSIDGAWSIWVDVGNPHPGGNTDCLGFIARAVGARSPADSCTYTQPS
ncbi:hypothetical protein F4861DRAFT_503787 [Xylaria intraflava]|nr:hypothetical protein F4861DRAFT_503787 [Xylaria intraflava]